MQHAALIQSGSFDLVHITTGILLLQEPWTGSAHL